MHAKIREAASAASFHEADGSFVILSCVAEDSAAILSADCRADTIIAVLTICTISSETF